MPNDDVQHWLDVKREAHEQARDHVNSTHCKFLIDGVLDGCRNILLATDVIVDPNAKLAFVEELYTAIRRTVSVGETMEQLEVTVRELWERCVPAPLDTNS
jgi:hypothetical protein